MIKLLIELGADVNLEDKLKQTPLFYASKFGRIPACEVLINAGANVNQEDSKQMTPVMLAHKSKKNDVSSKITFQIVEFLVSKGA